MFKNIVFIILTISFFKTSSAQTVSPSLKEESDIYEKIYDAPLILDETQPTPLHELYNTKPLLVVLIFTRCTGVCNPFLLRLKESLQFKAKKDSFNVLVISFDPRDSIKDMNLLARRFALEDNNQWIFAVTDSISKLNQSISFYPVWDSIRNQYDHDALLVGVNNEGYITKKLIGMRGGHDLDLLIASVNNVFSPTYRLPNKNVLFSCFNYDPKTGKNKLGLGLLFIALPAILTVLILIVIGFSVRSKASELEESS